MIPQSPFPVDRLKPVVMKRDSPGFTLVEIAVVLVIVGLIAAMFFAGLRTSLISAKFRATSQALQNADAGLVNYVMLTRHLPCPANGSLPSTDPNYGAAAASCPNPADQANGVVPWTTLGLAQVDVTDGFGNLLTYRVFAALVANESMNMTMCDAAGGRLIAAPSTPSGCACPDPAVSPASSPAIPTDCTQPTIVLALKGLVVQGVTVSNPAASPPSGAAYVLISHGPNLGPSYSAQGGLNPGIGTIGTNETANGVGQGVQASYFDSNIDTTDTVTHFDDILIHPSIANVASRAGLGPRTHNP
jgi:prepilin-type N-terminal cleavage/methylation domain-containing protein